LLISMTVAVAKNKRANGADVFEPFPTSIQAIRRKSPNEGGGEEILSFFQNNTKLLNNLEETCEKLPSVADMKKFTDEQKLKEMLDAKDPLCFPLIRWIVMSNRCHISPLPKDKHIKEMDTEFQFVLVSDNPAKEALFRRRRSEIAKKKGKGARGSFYAFHGSALGNWHCILRIGLKNYSNTNKMSTGAAYGEGIYMASNASTSFSYMVPGNTWTKSSLGNGSNIACIAVVEVLDLRGEPNCPIHDHSGILTCTDETIITTRYFFIYPQASNYWNGKGANAIANNLKLPEDIYL